MALPERSSKRRRRITTAVLLVGMVALAATTARAVKDSRGLSLPSPAALIGALVLTRTAMACTARAWVHLVGPPAVTSVVVGAFYESQLLKYLPAGGVLQAVGQVSMTSTRGVPVKRVSLAYVTLAIATVVAGLFIGTGLSLITSAPPWIRVASLAGVVAPVLLHHRVLRWSLHRARRLSRRIPEPDLLPDQRTLWIALLWSGANHLLYAAGFVVLLQGVSPDTPVVSATIAYTVSWVVGFLVLPLPSGVGVREAVLVGLVADVTAAPLLAASLAQRLVAIAAELLAAGGNRLLRLYRRRTG